MAAALRRTAEAVLASATTVVLGLLTLLLSAGPHHPRARPGLRGRHRGRRDLRAARAAGGPGALRPLGVLAAGAARRRAGARRHRLAAGAGSATASRAGPRAFVAGAVVAPAVLAIGAAGSDRARQADQFLDEPEAIAAAERLGGVVPGRRRRPDQVADPRRRRARSLAAVESTSRACDSRATAGRADGIAQVDVVLDAEPGHRRPRATTVEDLRDALGAFDEPTSAAPRPRRSTRRPPPSATGADRPADPRPGAARRCSCCCARWSRRCCWCATVVATYVAALGPRGGSSPACSASRRSTSAVPLLAFLFLVALGVDYNIFLVTRAREEAASTAPARACCAR